MGTFDPTLVSQGRSLGLTVRSTGAGDIAKEGLDLDHGHG
jgi:hypothetical protein